MTSIPPSSNSNSEPIIPITQSIPSKAQAESAWNDLQSYTPSLQDGDLPNGVSLDTVKADISTVLRYMHAQPSSGQGPIEEFQTRLSQAYGDLPENPHYAPASDYKMAGKALSMAQWPE